MNLHTLRILALSTALVSLCSPVGADSDETVTAPTVLAPGKQCVTQKQDFDTNNHINHFMTLLMSPEMKAQGFSVTGGGCSITDGAQDTDAQAIITQSTPTHEGDGWVCRYSHRDNTQPSGILTAYIRVCR